MAANAPPTQGQERSESSVQDPEFDENLLHQYDQDSLERYIVASPRSEELIGGVRYLSPNLVAKGGSAEYSRDGLEAMKLAYGLGVRVPAVKRVYDRENGDQRVIMERVQGETLMDCWHRLGWFTSLGIAFQLRGFVRKMRALVSPTAGAIYSGDYHSIWIDDMDHLPLKTTSAEVADFFNFWGNYTPPPLPSGQPQVTGEVQLCKFSPDESLVFTHQDLAPRNLMIDKQNRIWVVDWGCAGWYPMYMEYVGMRNFWTPLHWTWRDKLRWNLFSWISVGRYPAEWKALAHARWWQMKSPYARRAHKMGILRK